MSAQLVARSGLLVVLLAAVSLLGRPESALAGGNSVRIGTGGINVNGGFRVGGFRGNVGFNLGNTFAGRNSFFVGNGFGGGNFFGGGSFFAGPGFGYCGNTFGFGGFVPGWSWGQGGYFGGWGGCGFGGWGGCAPWGWGGFGGSNFFATTYGYGYPFGVGRFGLRPIYAGYNGIPCVPINPLFYGYGNGFGLLPDSGLPIYGRRFGIGGGLTPPMGAAAGLAGTSPMPPTMPMTRADAAPTADVPVSPYTPEGLALLLAAQQGSLGNRPTPAITGARLPLAGFHTLGNRPLSGSNP